MTRPEGLFDVQPKAIATYTAMRWIGDENDPALLWMVERFSWKIVGMRDSIRKGRALLISGKKGKRYLLAYGDYLVALGPNGSMRVCNEREFASEYKEAGA